MEMTNQGDLSIEKPREFKVVEDGTWEAEYKGYRPYKEDGMWGHKEGVRLQFRITKGPFANEFVSFKGPFFQDQATGKYVVGRKSKLADAIRVITGGTDSLNKGHEGTLVFVTVVVSTAGDKAKKPGTRYSNVTAVIPVPRDYSPAQTMAAKAAPAPAPAPAAAPAATPTPQTQPAATPVKNNDLLDELSDLSDFGN